MNDSENRVRALTFQHPEYIPVGVGILPAAWMQYRDDLEAIVRRHPAIFGKSDKARDYDHMAQGSYLSGEHVDAWGCVWSNVHDGMEAIVTHHPLPHRADIWQLQPPKADTGFRHGFMYLRLCDLRGFEEAMLDFAEEPPELQRLIDIVLEYNLRQARLRLASLGSKPEILYFGDDLGMQKSLAIGPAKWRKYLKPAFAQIYKPFCEAGHYVYMHTDGHILPIIADLIDCGVKVLNPQIRANGLDNLVATCKGKVCVNLDLDRQLFPFVGPAEIDAHIREAVEKLGAPEGGLWLLAEVGPCVPLENIAAICQALEKYRYFYTPREATVTV